MFREPGCVNIRQAASRAKLNSVASQFRILHFATHGLYDESNPMYSGISLYPGEGGDGFWPAREIAEADLNADLVVFSACDTARGKIRSGEGLLGLSWALFVGGSRSSVLSQWQVNDASTSELMKQFYGGMQPAIALGDSVLHRAESLRAAQLKIATGGKWPDPYYWAPFALIGDWR